jgi:hypothetical protein
VNSSVILAHPGLRFHTLTLYYAESSILGHKGVMVFTRASRTGCCIVQHSSQLGVEGCVPARMRVRV